MPGLTPQKFKRWVHALSHDLRPVSLFKKACAEANINSNVQDSWDFSDQAEWRGSQGKPRKNMEKKHDALESLESTVGLPPVFLFLSGAAWSDRMVETVKVYVGTICVL